MAKYLPVLLGGPLNGVRRVVSRRHINLRFDMPVMTKTGFAVREGALLPPPNEYRVESCEYIRRAAGIMGDYVEAYVYSHHNAEASAEMIWEYLTSMLGPQP